MKKFIITEEEKNNILKMHKKHILKEQGDMFDKYLDIVSDKFGGEICDPSNKNNKYKFDEDVKNFQKAINIKYPDTKMKEDGILNADVIEYLCYSAN
jgi:hypothetical protein